MINPEPMWAGTIRPHGKGSLKPGKFPPENRTSRCSSFTLEGMKDVRCPSENRWLQLLHEMKWRWPLLIVFYDESWNEYYRWLAELYKNILDTYIFKLHELGNPCTRLATLSLCCAWTWMANRKETKCKRMTNEKKRSFDSEELRTYINASFSGVSASRKHESIWILRTSSNDCGSSSNHSWLTKSGLMNSQAE